jgi:hypothetical protein
VLAAIAFNLTRAAGAIASVFHAKATTATIRHQLFAVPGRLAKSAPATGHPLPQGLAHAGLLGMISWRGLPPTNP